MNEADSPADEELRRTVEDLLDRLVGPHDLRPDFHLIRRDRRSNSVDEVHLADGRKLIVKRARDPQNAYRFEVSRVASALLREVPDVVAPEYLSLREGIDDPAVLVYWWVPGRTLHELWPEVPADARPEAVRSFGRIVRRLQEVTLPGHGALLEARTGRTELGPWLRVDLGERLLPAVEADWPDGAAAVRALLEAVPDVARAVSGPPVLVHNDLFDQNVLCSGGPETLACVGVIDFEDAFAGPPEAELAKTEILHGPLFGQPWLWDWRPYFLEGWGAEPEPLLLAFFRAHQLANMGYHARLVGLDAHAREVARTLEAEVRALGSGASHREVHEGARA